jgi:adenine C2-methylase RlmN of 23S rRNA A2503 and tRNA A37
MVLDDIFRDVDGTFKVVCKDEHGYVEIARLTNAAHPDRYVYCAPTHYNCTLNCKICHLTNSNQRRIMKPISVISFNKAMEIVVANLPSKNNMKKPLISFMGVGEPLLNLKLIMDITQNTNYSYALATMIPNIDALRRVRTYIMSSGVDLKIYVSLHSPKIQVRQYLLPSSGVDNLDTLFYELSLFPSLKSRSHTTTDSVVIHYTLIENVNNSGFDFDLLKNLLLKYKLSIKFIVFNEHDKYKQSIDYISWVEKLRTFGIRASWYIPPGKNIGSSCGEFVKHYYLLNWNDEENKEFIEWKNKYRYKGITGDCV